MILEGINHLTISNMILRFLRNFGDGWYLPGGGDPLVHPDIVEIVRLTAQNGLKPIINTNGLALNREFLLELKGAVQ